jgi:hypothetical protein
MRAVQDAASSHAQDAGTSDVLGHILVQTTIRMRAAGSNSHRRTRRNGEPGLPPGLTSTSRRRASSSLTRLRPASRPFRTNANGVHHPGDLVSDPCNLMPERRDRSVIQSLWLGGSHLGYLEFLARQAASVELTLLRLAEEQTFPLELPLSDALRGILIGTTGEPRSDASTSLKGASIAITGLTS